MAFERRTFTGPDGRRTIYYRGGSGQPLVFLHGGGVDASCYAQLLQLLAEQYTIIAPNLAGHGGSSAPGKCWQWNDYAAPIAALLRELGIAEAAVVGHSFGGAVAAHLAASNLSTSRLVLVDCAGTPLQWSLGSMLHLMFIQRVVDSFCYGKPGVAARLMGSFVANLVRAGIHVGATLSDMRRLLTSTDDVFSRINVPTLILWGKSDGVFPLPAAEAIRAQVGNATVQILDGDHEWCLFQPELAARKIADWSESNR